MASNSVHIRSVADLFNALESRDSKTRLAVLQSILQEPSRALKLGQHHGEDLIDLLIRTIESSTGYERQLRVHCLMSFRSPRTRDFLLVEFGRSRDAATVLRLGQRLQLDAVEEAMLPYLWDERPPQRLAAARVLTAHPELSPAQRLRIALVVDQQFDPPPMNDSLRGIWLQELKGPLQISVIRLLETQGEAALQLWNSRDELPNRARSWLLDWSLLHHPAQIKPLLPELLADPNWEIPALHGAARVGCPLSKVERFLSHPDPEVVASAIVLGSADGQLREFLTEPTPTPVRLAAVRRCRDTASLVSLLGDKHWAIRAEATNRLVALGADCLAQVRPLTQSSTPGERVAAAEVLRRLDDIDWLEKNLLVSLLSE